MTPQSWVFKIGSCNNIPPSPGDNVFPITLNTQWHNINHKKAKQKPQNGITFTKRRPNILPHHGITFIVTDLSHGVPCHNINHAMV